MYVSGIKDDIDEADLQEYFVQFGNVEEVEIMTEKSTGKKRGFAFITYDDYDPVDKVVCKYGEMELILMLFRTSGFYDIRLFS